MQTDEYQPDTLEDDDLLYAIKEAIQSLRPMERKIFLTYTELGTYTQAAKTFHVSVPTIRKYINEIRQKIYGHINDDAVDGIDNDTDLR